MTTTPMLSMFIPVVFLLLTEVTTVPYGDKFGDSTVIVNVEIENGRDQAIVIEKTFVRSGVFDHLRNYKSYARTGWLTDGKRHIQAHSNYSMVLRNSLWTTAPAEGGLLLSLGGSRHFLFALSAPNNFTNTHFNWIGIGILRNNQTPIIGIDYRDLIFESDSDKSLFEIYQVERQAEFGKRLNIRSEDNLVIEAEMGAEHVTRAKIIIH